MEEKQYSMVDICKNMRRDCLIMAEAAGVEGFHFGASLSMIELMAVLYFRIMNMNTSDDERDHFILSKGHGVPALYAAMEQSGILDLHDLNTFKTDGSELSGHPCVNERLGIEFSSGSLGQGLSFAVGKALALKQRENQTSKVYVILGDGECDEGSIWEAAMTASKYCLNNLVVIIDRNHLQYDGYTEVVMPVDSLLDKWKSFGWDTREVDGHNLWMLEDALRKESSMPYIIVANTIKGKGISFMEGAAEWHHGIMSKQQKEQAYTELCR